jgi:hypothetical protein
MKGQTRQKNGDRNNSKRPTAVLSESGNHLICRGYPIREKTVNFLLTSTDRVFTEGELVLSASNAAKKWGLMDA